MKRAIEDCKKRFGRAALDYCIIDGNREIDLDLPHKLIVKGDAKSLSIASASILAKVHRDAIMKQYHKARPEYGFNHNKGYKCEEHFRGLDQRGIWVGVHRTSLFPLSKPWRVDKDWTLRRRLWIQRTEEYLHKGDTL
jgi:ribonuclease HII